AGGCKAPDGAPRGAVKAVKTSIEAGGGCHISPHVELAVVDRKGDDVAAREGNAPGVAPGGAVIAAEAVTVGEGADAGKSSPRVEQAVVDRQDVDSALGQRCRGCAPGGVVPAADELTVGDVVGFCESSPHVELAVILREGVDGTNTPSIPGSDGAPGGAVPAAEVVTEVDAAAVLESSPDVELAVVDREELDITSRESRRSSSRPGSDGAPGVGGGVK